MSPSGVPAIRIDVETEWAWCGRERLQLIPKTFAVLRHLGDHAGRVCTKEEFLAAVWRDTIVSGSALTFCRKGDRYTPERMAGDGIEPPIPGFSGLGHLSRKSA